MTEEQTYTIKCVVQRHLDAICQELHYEHKIDPADAEVEKLVDDCLRRWMVTGDTDD